MLDTHKLLYILPDVAYVAELLPGKKEHTFVVHSFRQINGEFIDENELIAKNIEKLFSKLTSDTYQLVLPDFLFTSTILEVKETSENKVKEHIKNTILPQLGLTQETHILRPFILNQYGQKSRIQLEAIEKSVLASVVKQAQDTNTTISSVVPLSWTIKSLISLEPSISVVQMGSRGYLALHYIGVDQTNDASIQDIDTLAETIKTLRGAEPSIQTVYLLTNDLIEEKLKEHLAGVIPVQQLTSTTNDSEMPSYVQQVIESGMKSLSIPEYAVPTFNMPKFSEIEAFLVDESEDDSSENSKDSEESGLESETTPQIHTLADDDEAEDSDDATHDEEDDKKSGSVKKESEDNTLKDAELPDLKEIEENAINSDLSIAAVATSHMNEISEVAASAETDLPKPMALALTTAPVMTPLDLLSDESQDADNNKKDEDQDEKAKDESTEASTDTPVKSETPETSLEESKPKETPAVLSPVVSTQTAQNKVDEVAVSIEKTQKPVIKNKSNLQPMLKMFFISVSVFFATVAVGVGIGLGFLTLTNNPFMKSDTNSQDAQIVPTPTPTPMPTPTPEPVVEIAPESLSVLVVNATTKAGYAGRIKTSLEGAGFEDVDTKNAKGEYETGMFLLLDEDNTNSTALLKLFEQSTDLTFTIGEDKIVEDATKQYDVVVVLAE